MYFDSIDELRKVARMNGSLPMESLEPYINDALDVYMSPFVGDELLDKGETDAALKPMIQRALGPLALFMAVDEFSVLIGDGGLTVANETGKRSPASDAKIAAAKANLLRRGMSALDRLIVYLDSHAEEYPEYAAHSERYSAHDCLVRSAREYQDEGLVDIGYSSTTYRMLVPTLLQLQGTELDGFLPDGLLSKLLAASTPEEQHMRQLCVRFLCNRAAGLMTSKQSKEQRSGGAVEYDARIRPMYFNFSGDGNFYDSQADFYLGKMSEYMRDHAESLEIEIYLNRDNNTKASKLFKALH